MVLKTLLDCEIEFCFYNSFASMSFLLMISRPQCLTKNQYYAYWLKNKIYKKALKPKLQCIISGSATGNRTPDFALRGRRLSRLTMAPLAPGLGLEPRPNDPESLVLPLHHPGVLFIRTKFIITEYSLFDKSFL